MVDINKIKKNINHLENLKLKLERLNKKFLNANIIRIELSFRTDKGILSEGYELYNPNLIKQIFETIYQDTENEYKKYDKMFSKLNDDN